MAHRTPLHPVFALAALGLLLVNLTFAGQSGALLVAGWSTLGLVLLTWTLYRRQRR